MYVILNELFYSVYGHVSLYYGFIVLCMYVSPQITVISHVGFNVHLSN